MIKNNSFNGLMPVLFLICLILPLGGCFTLLEAPAAAPMVTLRLDPPSSPLCPAPVNKQLVVAAPSVDRSLRTDRIALMFDERELKYLSGTKWENIIPVMLQNAMLKYIAGSGCFSGVGDETMGLASSFRLRSSVDLYHLAYSGDDPYPTAVFRMQAYILNTRDGVILHSRTFDTRQKALGSGEEYLLEAMDYVTHKTMLDMAVWVNASMQEIDLLEN